MTNILLSGCNGKMGRAVYEYTLSRDDCQVVAGVDITESSQPFSVYKSPFDFDGKADVIIDFSNPAALSDLIEYSLKTNTPAVIATTGLSEEQVNLLKLTSKQIPIFFSFNMSLGINLLSELAKTAARVLGSTFDIEIVEAHHNQKLDAPSGTAIMLADSISGVLDEKPRYEYDRHLKREKRAKNEIGMHSIRGGTIVGEHEIIFAGHDEVIKLSHSAGSKRVFAAGAVNAAVFIAGKEPGMYSMKDLVSE
ncbi:MAG: 4-hydroxy-tetrahydrodipicolinate reductase [Clostridiales bacterium]|nr:4-hydroxy-tetrahydrodipicolinate reductase [Clostridiales bacterium]